MRLIELVQRPPAHLVDVLGGEVDASAQARARRRARDGSVRAAGRCGRTRRTCGRASRSRGPRSKSTSARLLGELAADRLLRGLSRVDASSRRRPPALAGRVDELHEQRPVAPVEDESARGGAVDRLEPVAERDEPAPTLVVGNGRVGRRGRREDEEPDVVERPDLRAELRPLAEDAAEGLLADERDRPRTQLGGDPLEALGRAREVGTAQVAGALSSCDTRRSSRRSRARGARTARAARTGAA